MKTEWTLLGGFREGFEALKCEDGNMADQGAVCGQSKPVCTGTVLAINVEPNRGIFCIPPGVDIFDADPADIAAAENEFLLRPSTMAKGIKRICKKDGYTIGYKPEVGPALKCVATGAATGAATGVATAPPQQPSTAFGELSAQYTKQDADYNAAITSALATSDVSQIPKIKQMNVEISKTLNKMIEQMTYLKKDTPDLKSDRDKLLENLRRIQKDYNGLLINTDTLETLRRIRQQESSLGKRELYWYIVFFLVIAFIMLLYVVFWSQKKESTAAIAMTPPTMAALV